MSRHSAGIPLNNVDYNAWRTPIISVSLKRHFFNPHSYFASPDLRSIGSTSCLGLFRPTSFYISTKFSRCLQGWFSVSCMKLPVVSYCTKPKLVSHFVPFAALFRNYAKNIWNLVRARLCFARVLKSTSARRLQSNVWIVEALSGRCAQMPHAR